MPFLLNISKVVNLMKNLVFHHFTVSLNMVNVRTKDEQL